MSQLMPIFENLRQKEDLPCSYPLHMHAPSYHWVNNEIFSQFSIAVSCDVVVTLTHLSLGFQCGHFDITRVDRRDVLRVSVDCHCICFFSLRYFPLYISRRLR